MSLHQLWRCINIHVEIQISWGTVSMGRIQGLSATLVSGHLAGSRNIHFYEGGLSISLSAVISMQPLGIEQANNPHMKAKDVPFHMGYGGLISSKALQNDRPK